MNPGNFSTIQKQLLFSKNSRHASLGELHIIPPTTAATVCGNLIFGLQAWGKPTWFSVSKGETAVGGLWPQCHCSSRSVPGLFMLRNTIPAPSQTYVAANPSSEMSRWKINWVINVTVPYTGVPGLLFTLIPAADWFVTENTGRTAVGRITAHEISGKQFSSAVRAGALPGRHFSSHPPAWAMYGLQGLLQQ